jgi:hypothetical protein
LRRPAAPARELAAHLLGDRILDVTDDRGRGGALLLLFAAPCRGLLTLAFSVYYGSWANGS